MGFSIQRFYRNREAVIKGTALFLLDIILIIASMTGALWMRYHPDYSQHDRRLMDAV